MINYESDKNFRAAMSHATETPKLMRESTLPMSYPDGFITMKLPERIKAAVERIQGGHASMRVPAEQTDPDLVLVDCNDTIADLERRLAAAAARADELIAVENMLILCGEREVRDVQGCPQKLRALIDALITQRRRADAAESALQSAKDAADNWKRLAEDYYAEHYHPEYMADGIQRGALDAHYSKLFGNTLPAPSKAAPEPTAKDLEQAAFEKWLSDKCPSGDVESVQWQWLQSYEYAEFLDEQEPVNAGDKK